VIVYPAIDILGGSAVRLVRGDFARATTYAEDPLEAARAWAKSGAEWVHVVDLDGARAGKPVNLEHVRRIAAETSLRVQLGGGLRSPQAVASAREAGAERVVLGTAAFTDVLEQLELDRLVVSVDARGGRVQTAGWTQDSALTVDEAIELLRGRGVQRFVYTDVDRDGMLGGVEVARIGEVAALAGELIYSGGISSLEDLRALAGLDIAGAIVGKALYEGRFTLAEALACT
jgi:phosphoribosylformimino-5-aminoimidazole carboxamide ribotide isomerase